MAYETMQASGPDGAGHLQQVLSNTGRLTVDDVWQGTQAGDAGAPAVLDRPRHVQRTAAARSTAARQNAVKSRSDAA
jgi:hypothetical protein